MANITTYQPRLSVPDAPRNANAKPLDATATAIEGLGARAASLGFQVARSEADAAAYEAKMAALREMNDLEFEIQTKIPAAAAEEHFATRSAEIFERHAGGGGQRFKQWFEPLAETGRMKVKRFAFSGKYNSLRRGIGRSVRGAAKAAAGGDNTVSVAARVDLAGDAIGDLERGGWISREEGDGFRKDLDQATAEEAIRTMIAGDPEEAARFIGEDAGLQVLGVAPERHEILSKKAAAAAKKAQKQREAEARATDSEITYDLGKVEGIVRDGLPVAEAVLEDLALRVEINGDPVKTQRLKAIEDVGPWIEDLRMQPPAEVEREINEVARIIQETGATAPLHARLEAGKAALAKMTSELERDPLSFANETGVLEVTPLDLTAPDLMFQVAARARRAHAVAQHYGVSPKFFTAQEATDLGEAFRTGTAPQRMALAETLVRGLGRDAGDGLAQLGDFAPATVHLAGLMTLGAEHGAAVKDGFEGQVALEKGASLLPDKAKITEAANAVLGTALDHRFSGFRETAIDAAKLIYAARAMRKGVSAFDADLFGEALEAAVGATTRDRVQYGGIGTDHGRAIILPPQMSEARFDRLRSQLLDPRGRSFGGGRPVHGDGREATPETLRDGFLVTVGPGLYQVSETDPGVLPRYLLDDATGGYYILDFNAEPRVPDPRVEPEEVEAPQKDQSRMPQPAPGKDQSRMEPAAPPRREAVAPAPEPREKVRAPLPPGFVPERPR